MSFAHIAAYNALKIKQKETTSRFFFPNREENDGGKAAHMRSEAREFFAAANTEEGFYSIFESVFPPSALDKIFIIKGGPGTGKSTLMR